jgi:hypothetical protein
MLNMPMLFSRNVLYNPTAPHIYINNGKILNLY